jgi:hypothetical protein
VIALDCGGGTDSLDQSKLGAAHTTLVTTFSSARLNLCSHKSVFVASYYFGCAVVSVDIEVGFIVGASEALLHAINPKGKKFAILQQNDHTYGF